MTIALASQRCIFSHFEKHHKNSEDTRAPNAGKATRRRGTSLNTLNSAEKSLSSRANFARTEQSSKAHSRPIWALSIPIFFSTCINNSCELCMFKINFFKNTICLCS